MALTINQNTEEILFAIMMENLEEILESMVYGNFLYYEDVLDDYDRVLIIFVGPMTYVLARKSASCDEAAVITELSDRDDGCAAVPELDDAIGVQEDAVPDVVEAAATGKRASRRRNMFSTGWKRVKRVFRALCCCGRQARR